MTNYTTHVAIPRAGTHKKEHKVALHYPGDEHIVEFTVKNTARDVKKMVNKIKKQAPADVAFRYETVSAI